MTCPRCGSKKGKLVSFPRTCCACPVCGYVDLPKKKVVQ